MGLNQLNSSNDNKSLFIMLIGAWNIYMYETIDNLGWLQPNKWLLISQQKKTILG